MNLFQKWYRVATDVLPELSDLLNTIVSTPHTEVAKMNEIIVAEIDSHLMTEFDGLIEQTCYFIPMLQEPLTPGNVGRLTSFGIL